MTTKCRLQTNCSCRRTFNVLFDGWGLPSCMIVGYRIVVICYYCVFNLRRVSFWGVVLFRFPCYNAIELVLRDVANCIHHLRPRGGTDAKRVPVDAQPNRNQGKRHNLLSSGIARARVIKGGQDSASCGNAEPDMRKNQRNRHGRAKQSNTYMDKAFLHPLS